ncbi:MAG: thermonuclease family protein [Sphingomonas sp.]|nr:thermonuclease family protein [Sphingomonas sp.]
MWRDWDRHQAPLRLRGDRTRRRRFGPRRLAATALALLTAILAWSLLPQSDAAPAASGASGTRALFTTCHIGGGRDCVVDGDTFWMGGVKIRIADIDTPETHPSRCAREAALGQAATRRLRALLNSGPVALTPIERAFDRYGRRLALVSVAGQPVGETLVAEGLARRYHGGRRAGWCD